VTVVGGLRIDGAKEVELLDDVRRLLFVEAVAAHSVVAEVVGVNSGCYAARIMEIEARSRGRGCVS
jgi:hypothetical protein